MHYVYCCFLLAYFILYYFDLLCRIIVSDCIEILCSGGKRVHDIKKHFEMIAEVLKTRANAVLNNEVSLDSKHYALFELRNTMYHLGEEFTQVNIMFDTGRFYKACEVQEKLEIILKELGARV